MPILSSYYQGEESMISNWRIFNISSNGMALQTDEIHHIPSVTSLVRLVWSHDKNNSKPQWGEVCWRRRLSVGKQHHLGIRFLPYHVAIWPTKLMDGDSDK